MVSAATRFLSPLRYPGGKGKLARFVGETIAAQANRPHRYVEPFAGGAGVALRLLYDEYVDEVILNDLDPGVAAFWRAVFEKTEQLVSLVQSTSPSIDEWHRQRAIYEQRGERDLDDTELGFAMFFLNRTNRSGILGARPIGGLNQEGKWGIAARYDAQQLVARIRLLARYGSRVTVSERDGIDLVAEQLREDGTFIYADPPYLTKADDLYMDTLRWENHVQLASVLRDAKGWMVTYDADERVYSELYPGLRCAAFGISHTAAHQHVGREFAVFAEGLALPSLSNLGRGDAVLLDTP